MIEIHATKGKVFIVDDEFAYLAKYKWYTGKSGALFYARRPLGGNRFQFLHREVLGLSGQRVDHWNGNTFDCRRENLRPCTQQQNCRNRRLRKDNRIRLKGVRVRPSKFSGPRFLATIFFDGRPHALGAFDTAEEAAHAYDEAAKRHFGEFAKTNEGMKHEA